MFFYLLPLVLIFACFVEIIIIDEEFLLTTCFLMFVVTAYAFLNSFVVNVFDSTRSKFRLDIWATLEIQYNSLFNKILLYCTITSFYPSLLVSYSCYLKILTNVYSTFTQNKINAILFRFNNFMPSVIVLLVSKLPLPFAWLLFLLRYDVKKLVG